jgi:hypothetical protein
VVGLASGTSAAYVRTLEHAAQKAGRPRLDDLAGWVAAEGNGAHVSLENLLSE